MINIPLAEAQTLLVQTQKAISDIISGKRINFLKINSDNFNREYHYSESTLSDLYKLRDDLLETIAALSPNTPAQFNKNSCFNLKVGKRVY
jgi:hypothetical protein